MLTPCQMRHEVTRVLFSLFHTPSLGRQPRDMEEKDLIQLYRIWWYRFPAAPLEVTFASNETRSNKRVSPSHFLLRLQSLYLFPYQAAGL